MIEGTVHRVFRSTYRCGKLSALPQPFLPYHSPDKFPGCRRAASSLYHSLEQLSNPEKEQFLPKILAIPGLSLNPNTTNPQNLACLVCRAPLAEKRQVVVWHDIINNSFNSHRTNNFRACTAEELTEILKTLTNISAVVYCQRNGTPDQGCRILGFFDIRYSPRPNYSIFEFGRIVPLLFGFGFGQMLLLEQLFGHLVILPLLFLFYTRTRQRHQTLLH